MLSNRTINRVSWALTFDLWPFIHQPWPLFPWIIPSNTPYPAPDGYFFLLGAKTLRLDPKIYVSRPYKQNDANPELGYSLPKPGIWLRSLIMAKHSHLPTYKGFLNPLFQALHDQIAVNSGPDRFSTIFIHYARFDTQRCDTQRCRLALSGKYFGVNTFTIWGRPSFGENWSWRMGWAVSRPWIFWTSWAGARSGMWSWWKRHFQLWPWKGQTHEPSDSDLYRP